METTPDGIGREARHRSAAETAAAERAESLAWFGRPDLGILEGKPMVAALLAWQRRRRSVYGNLASASAALAVAGPLAAATFGTLGPGGVLASMLGGLGVAAFSLGRVARASAFLATHRETRERLGGVSYAVTGAALYVIEDRDSRSVDVMRYDATAFYQVEMDERNADTDIMLHVAGRSIVLTCLRDAASAHASLSGFGGRVARSVVAVPPPLPDGAPGAGGDPDGATRRP